jgi:hypothetical protein
LAGDLAAALSRLRAMHASYWDHDWRREHRGFGRYPEHHLWEAVQGYLELYDAAESADRAADEDLQKVPVSPDAAAVLRRQALRSVMPHGWGQQMPGAASVTASTRSHGPSLAEVVEAAGLAAGAWGNLA